MGLIIATVLHRVGLPNLPTTDLTHGLGLVGCVLYFFLQVGRLPFFYCWSGSERVGFHCFMSGPVWGWTLTLACRVRVNPISQKMFKIFFQVFQVGLWINEISFVEFQLDFKSNIWVRSGTTRPVQAFIASQVHILGNMAGGSSFNRNVINEIYSKFTIAQNTSFQLILQNTLVKFK